MKFAPKLLLAVLTCIGRGQLVCSQAASTATTATSMTSEERKKQALELLRQANELLAGTKDSAEQKQAVTQAVLQVTSQSAPQATSQEIVERDAKRVKLSAEDERWAIEKQRREQEENWVLSYAQKLSPEVEQKLAAAKIALTNEAIVRNRATILPAMLYDLLKCMPRELTNMIAEYAKPYTLKEELDHPLTINLPTGITITAITSPLLSHGTTIIIGFSNGGLQIYKENCKSTENWELKQIAPNNFSSISSITNGLRSAGFKVKTKWFKDKSFSGSQQIYIYKENSEKEAKKHWELQQSEKAHSTAITKMVSLKDKMFATSSDKGNIKVWGLNDKQQYELKKIIPTGFKIKKLANAPDGNIILLGQNIRTQEEDDSFYLSVWNPVSGQCLLRPGTLQKDYGLRDFTIYSDGCIVGFGGFLPYIIENISGDYEENEDEDGCYVDTALSANKLYNSCILANDDIVTVLPLKNSENAALMLNSKGYYNQYSHKVDCLTIRKKENFKTVIALQDGTIALAGDDVFLTADPKDRTEYDYSYVQVDPSQYRDIQQLLQLPDGRLLIAYKNNIEIYN